MSAFQLALRNLTRKGGPTVILVISLALAIGGASLLYRIYNLQMDRYESLSVGPQSVVGAKASGIEILLGALRLEDFRPGYVPYNLYLTLKKGLPIKFEDGSAVNSGQFVQRAIPLLFISKLANALVVATDESMMEYLKITPSPLAVQQLVVGSRVAEENHYKVGDSVRLKLRDYEWFEREFKIGTVLPAKNSIWDQTVFMDLDEAHSWISEVNVGHPVWGSNVLHYFMIEMNMAGFPALRSLINERSVSQMISVEDEKVKLQNLIGVGGRVGLLIVGLILLLAGLAIGGMMNLRTEAMRVSAAVLRAIGFSRSYVARWLFFETTLIFVTAFIFSLFVEWGLFGLLYPHLKNILPVTSDGPLTQMVLVFPVWLVALLFAVVGMLIPYLRLSAQNVHEELKGI